MSKTPVIVTYLCFVCGGSGKILKKPCINCKASGYIHSELKQVQRNDK